MQIDKKQVAAIEAVGGMALVLLGQRLKGLALFSHGFYNLEQEYRKTNPDLPPGFKARWNSAIIFYDQTHQHEVSRSLHRWGIPMIVGGALGLLAAPIYRKVWWNSAFLFAVGWALNIVGHSKYEKNKPAFTEDPLSFIAGPVWDFKQLKNGKTFAQVELRLVENEQ